MKERVEKIVQEAVRALLMRSGKGSDDVPRIVVERPKDVAHGDWTTNVSFVLAKTLSRPPMEVASLLVQQIAEEKHDAFEIITPVGGYINFTYATVVYEEIVQRIADDDFYKGSHAAQQKIVVEYTQPNPFKPFHIGHLMSNTIGESISRLLETTGAEVIRANYQGDVGPHVAKALWALGAWGEEATDIGRIGEAYAYGHKMSEEDADVKAQITVINRAVYEGSDEVVMALYHQGRAETLKRFEEIYALLGTHFDQYYFESEVWKRGKELVEAHIGTIFEESDGAVIFPGETYGLHTRVFITREGLPTYEAKELGLAMIKHEKNNADVYLITTAVEQQSYFTVVKKAIELTIPDLEGKIMHISHGMMQLTDGKMSSRKGNVVTGESLIEDARTVAREKISERVGGDVSDRVVDQIAVGGVKFSILKQAIGKDIAYDTESALSFEGDAGPYLQYTFARSRSVLDAAKERGISGEEQMIVFDPETIEIVRLLDQFEERVAYATVSHAPHIVANNLLELARTFNSFYAAHKIVTDDVVAPYRVRLTAGVARVMGEGLRLLGIQTPREM